MKAAGPAAKRQRMTSGQRVTYRDQVIKVVKARLAAAPADPNRPALRLPESMESNGEAPSIIF